MHYEGEFTMVRKAICVVSVIVLALVSTGCPKGIKVPNVQGKTLAAATTAIVAAQLTVGTTSTASSQTVAAGLVISQDPAAGASVSSGTAVDLVISTGPAPALDWSYVPDESSVWGLTVSNTSDGGCIVSGGYNTSYDMYAMKFDNAGDLDWDAIYSNISTEGSHPELWHDEARGAQQTADGGYIMVTSGGVSEDGLSDDAFVLVKTDAAGNVDWSKAYLPQNPYSAGNYCVGNRPRALEITDDGGYLVVGYSYVGMYNLASILKTDADGNVDFVKVINDNARAYEQIITGGQQTADGGYILTGYSGNGSPHGYLALLIKLDSDGDLEFSETYQYTAGGYGAESYAVAQTADGGYVFGGELINPITKVSTYGCWLAKVDADGDVDWFNWYGHGPTIHYPKAIQETPEGDIVAGGADNVGDMTLAKFDSEGTLLWNFTMPDTFPGATVNDLTLTDDGGCIMVGSGISGGTLLAKVNYVFSTD